ncbi:hypothetical protein [Merismopedia glauca]|uniref:PEP-CTERM sorting domain-containing protein n=1 Tax=Merismopedia glauca CCAP 1448/3 TaxID=1296344 RepID=A0A2T1BYF5_9CYAN|nr:hypothetical protein [Merismopedia glauca]PSB01065.1 hypothetical protein C7B64_20290 [Merismopedia glauca CCAP 1448/3]
MKLGLGFTSVLTAGLVLLSFAGMAPSAFGGQGGVAVGIGFDLNPDGSIDYLVGAAAVGKTSAFSYAMTDNNSNINVGALGTGAAFEVHSYVDPTGESAAYQETDVFVEEESVEGLGSSQANQLDSSGLIDKIYDYQLSE